MDIVEEITVSLLALISFGLICLLIQKFWPAIPSQKPWRRESLLDLKYWAFSTVINFYTAGFLLALIITVSTISYPPLREKILSSAKGDVEVIQVIIALVVLDFAGYWAHRFFHSPQLWNYHAIHHSPNEIDWLTTYRFHPLEAALVAAFIYSSCLVFGLGIKDIAIALTLRSTYGFLVHANVKWNYGPLGYVIASPYFHRWHHSKDAEAMDKNFAGVFSLWDFIFGTAYYPKNKIATNLGIHENIGNSFWQQFLHPFKKKKQEHNVLPDGSVTLNHKE